jgi:hypothetical protein
MFDSTVLDSISKNLIAMNPTNEEELLLSHVYSDLDVDPELQMTVQEFVNIDKDLLTSQDVSDVNIIESVILDTSEDSQTDD